MCVLSMQDDQMQFNFIETIAEKTIAEIGLVPALDAIEFDGKMSEFRQFIKLPENGSLNLEEQITAFCKLHQKRKTPQRTISLGGQ